MKRGIQRGGLARSDVGIGGVIMKRTYVLLTVSLLLVTGCARTTYWWRKAPAEARYASAPAAPPPSPVIVAGVESSTVGLGSPESDPAQTQRIMIYNGAMTLVVEDIQATLDTIREDAESVGGYMQAMDARSITVKVPADDFQNLIAAVEKLGAVTQKEIKGSDVTEEMRDLRIRLQNAEEIRKRLVALLELIEKVEDALNVEKELGRVTETIELLKGKIRALENQVAYSTLTVHLNSPVPQRVIKEEIPFPWVTELAGDMARGRVTVGMTRTRGRHVDFELPESFAKYHEADYVTRATSADGVLLKVERHDNVEGADLAFWTTLISRSLTAKQTIVIKQVRDITIEDNVEAKIIEGVKEIGRTEYAYLAAVAHTDDYVYTYEAWGPTEKFANARQSLEKSIRSMDILTFFQGLFR